MCKGMKDDVYIFGLKKDQFMLALQSAATYIYLDGQKGDETDAETVPAGAE